jgi:hypothetical protein
MSNRGKVRRPDARRFYCVRDCILRGLSVRLHMVYYVEHSKPVVGASHRIIP